MKIMEMRNERSQSGCARQARECVSWQLSCKKRPRTAVAVVTSCFNGPQKEMCPNPIKLRVPHATFYRSPRSPAESQRPRNRSHPVVWLTSHQQFGTSSDANHENQIDSRLVVLRSRQIYVAATIWLLATWNDLRKGHDLWNRQCPPYQHRIQNCVRAEVKQTSLQGSAYHFQRTSPSTGLWISKLRENCNLTENETTSFRNIASGRISIRAAENI